MTTPAETPSAHDRAASKTADGAAATRASHFLDPEHPKVYEDELAYSLTSPGWQLVLRYRPLHWFVRSVFFKRIRGVFGIVLGRARFADERLSGALADGCEQVVLLGAGMDSIAIRRASEHPRVRWFELDHPASQAVKVRRVEDLPGGLPSTVSFVPADFEHVQVDALLGATELDPDKPSFVTWLGVSFYLSTDAVEATLRGLRSVCAPGTQLVLDYLDEAGLVEPHDPTIAALMRWAAKRGELLQTGFAPEAFAQLARRTGFEVTEDLDGAAQHERFFSGRRDGLGPTPFFRLAALTAR